MARKRELSLQYSSLKGLNDERKYSKFGAQQTIITNARTTISGEIPGTIPEKIVYDYLLRLRINFQYQYHAPENKETYMRESDFIPEFILPDYNVIIEVFGLYYHSQNKGSDDIRKMYYDAAGYAIIEKGIPSYPAGRWHGGKVVIWWENEIYYGLDHLFSRDLPEINEMRIRGKVAENVQDIPKAFLNLERMRAKLTESKIKPKRAPYKTRTFRLSRKPTKF